MIACAPEDVSKLGGLPLREIGVVGGGVRSSAFVSAIWERPGAPDVRRARHLRSRPRRSSGRALRAARTPASRTGVRRNRRLRPRAPDRAPRDGARRPGLQRAEARAGSTGQLAIGHTRYSTTGSAQWSNAQPIVQHGTARTVALGHNGNLVNAGELRAELSASGAKLGSSSDTELIAALIANDRAPLPEAVANAMGRLEGAYSVTALAEGKLVAFRARPASVPSCSGASQDGLVVGESETCALDLLGAELEREIGHGEVVVDRRPTVSRARQAVPAAGRRRSASSSSSTSPGLTRASKGVEVHGARVRMGERLAEEAPVEADLVVRSPTRADPQRSGLGAPGSRTGKG